MFISLSNSIIKLNNIVIDIFMTNTGEIRAIQPSLPHNQVLNNVKAMFMNLNNYILYTLSEVVSILCEFYG